MLPGKRTSVRYPPNRQQANQGKPADAREIALEQLVAIKASVKDGSRKLLDAHLVQDGSASAT
jgi:hypothetical protein